MKAMTILQRCRSAEADKRRIRQQIARRRDAITCITPRMDGDGGGHAAAEQDKIGAFVEAVDELERRLKLREQAQSVEIAAACALLDALPENEGAVLHQYYVRRSKITAIAARLGYSEGHTRRLKAEGERLLDALPDSAVDAALPAWYAQRYAAM